MDYCRTKFAMEHSSPEALQEYLRAHPAADPSKHEVKSPEKGHGDSHGHGDSPSKGGLLSAIKGLGPKLKGAPAAAKKFFEDPAHRKEVLKGAGKHLRDVPKKYVASLIETAKHEVHEFKEAGHGIAAVVKGKKPTPEQKKAIKQVATHLAISASAAALTAASPALAGLAIGKGLAKHVALKAAAKAVADLHILEEVSHIGHGLHHLLHLASEDKDEKLTPDEAFAALVLQKVAEEVEKLSDKDIGDALEDKDESEEEEQTKKQASNHPSIINALRGEFKKLSVWSEQFNRTMLKSKAQSEDATEGYVWQDLWVDYWQPLNTIQNNIWTLGEGLYGTLSRKQVDAILDPPIEAQVTTAVESPIFLDDSEGEESIAYSIRDLEAWNREFKKWIGLSQKTLASLI